jgi:alkyl hydroperoxide reductase subunit D
MDQLKERIPDYAKDLRLNLAGIERIDSLDRQQLWGTVLACARATRSGELVRALEPLARERLGEAACAAASSAAAVMGMNNVYYRFLHLVGNDAYGRLPARLRMQALAAPDVPRLDFELWCLAVSAVNGCGRCIESHEAKLRESGASELAVQDAVRIAAILSGVAQVLDAEAALASSPSA